MSISDDKTYYEILNINDDASTEDIEKAYYDAKKLYGDESIATYALFTIEEREVIINNMSMAYETLTDPVKRKEYDLELKATGASTESDENLIVVKNINRQSGGNSKPSIKTPKMNLIHGLKQSLVVLDDDNNNMALESYRILGSKLHQIAKNDSLKVFAITSALKGEGKTITSLNLAYIIASQFKRKTLLLEWDFRKPSISSDYLGKIQKHGLVDVMKGNANLPDVILQLDKTNLYILPAIHQVQNSAELLASYEMSEILEKLKAQFEFIIIDCPPILYLADLDIIGKMVDGVILVVRAGKTAKDIVTKALKTISKKQARGRRQSDSEQSNVVGVVLNAAEETRSRYYYPY